MVEAEEIKEVVEVMVETVEEKVEIVEVVAEVMEEAKHLTPQGMDSRQTTGKFGISSATLPGILRTRQPTVSYYKALPTTLPRHSEPISLGMSGPPEISQMELKFGLRPEMELLSMAASIRHHGRSTPIQACRGG